MGSPVGVFRTACSLGEQHCTQVHMMLLDFGSGAINRSDGAEKGKCLASGSSGGLWKTSLGTTVLGDFSRHCWHLKHILTKRSKKYVSFKWKLNSVTRATFWDIQFFILFAVLWSSVMHAIQGIICCLTTPEVTVSIQSNGNLNQF